MTYSPNTASNVKSVTIKVTETDAAAASGYCSSGIASIKYQWTTSNTALATNNTSWNSAVTVTNGGSIIRNSIIATNYLQTLVTDNAGNQKVFVS